MTNPWLTIIGIGEDGFAALGNPAQQALSQAGLVVGGERHLGLVPPVDGQQRLPWPSPFSQGIDLILSRRGIPTCILASGDPMHYGVGSTLSRHLDAGEMRVLSAPSAFSLAAARLGWALQECVALTVHGRPLELVHPHLHPGAKLLILSEGAHTPRLLAHLLTARRFGGSKMTVLEHMGGGNERCFDGIAADWRHADGADLNVVAVECVGHGGFSVLAGLPDDAFHHDGQITKRDVRAATLARLAPEPGQLLWDVGAGSGSIGIEWMRSHPSCRAIAIEANAERQHGIEHNRQVLGVPELVLVAGRAPNALQGLPAPDAIFVGGGLTSQEVPEICWNALKPGGRMAANAVTLESAALLLELHRRWGGELTQITVANAESLGRFQVWRPAMTVTLWIAYKPL